MPPIPTGRPARRPRRPSLGTEQFLERVLDLFVEHGYEVTSVDTIPAEVGFAKRTFSQRHGDKESLFRASMQHAIRQWIVPVERLQAAESATLDQSLLAVGRILVTNVLSDEGMKLMRLTNAVSSRMPEIGAYSVRLGTEPTVEYIAGLLGPHLDLTAEAARDGADLYLSLVVGGPANAAAWGAALAPAELERRTLLSVQTFLHGILGTLPGSMRETDPDLPKDVLADALAALKESQLRIEQALGPEA